MFWLRYKKLLFYIPTNDTFLRLTCENMMTAHVTVSIPGACTPFIDCDENRSIITVSSLIHEKQTLNMEFNYFFRTSYMLVICFLSI